MKRLSLFLLVASLAGTALLTGTARASDKTSCGSKVISDWYDNGRIDRVYPTVCYRQALDHLPLDVDQYANARDVITRAMAAEIAVTSKPSRHQTTPSDTNQTDTTQTSTNQSSVPPTSTDGNPPGTANSHADPLLTRAINRLGPSNANSIPVPLVVLGALALLLLAAGAAGVVARKLQERRLPATPVGTPPPDAPPAS